MSSAHGRWSRVLQDATGLSIKKIIHTLRPLQQITVRLAGRDPIASDAITPAVQEILSALSQPAPRWHESGRDSPRESPDARAPGKLDVRLRVSLGPREGALPRSW